MGANEGGREVVVEAGEDAGGERLDRFLAARLERVSRSRIKALVESGRVAARGATITDPSYRVKPGQTFAIILPEPEPASPTGQPIALDIVHEDADVIVVNKPAGMAVHPAPGSPDSTLVNALIAHCGASLSGIGGVRRPGIVHRLDKDTTGLVVAAKNDAAHQALAAAFASRERVERAYLAVVWGVPAPGEGEIVGAIGRHPANRRKMAVLSRGGKPAITRYRLLRPLGPAASLVECRLATGRTHQIRVHMASIGHLIVGDPLYGRATAARLAALNPEARSAVEGIGRQALHAYRLGFVHPGSGEQVRWEVAFPEDIRRLVRSLEGL